MHQTVQDVLELRAVLYDQRGVLGACFKRFKLPVVVKEGLAKAFEHSREKRLSVEPLERSHKDAVHRQQLIHLLLL